VVALRVQTLTNVHSLLTSQMCLTIDTNEPVSRMGHLVFGRKGDVAPMT
jgi:hypothetical protein